MTVTIYSKPNCPQCTATVPALKARNIAFEPLDLSAADEAMIFVQQF